MKYSLSTFGSCLLASGILTLGSVSAQTPVLEFLFNTNSASQTSTGSVTGVTGSFSDGAVIGAAGSGVSGNAADLSFDNTASTGMGSAGSGGIFTVPGIAEARNLQQMSLVLWFKASGTNISNQARLGAYSNNWQSFSSGSGNPGLSVPPSYTDAPGGSPYNGIDTWIFYAAVFDHTLETVNYYKGTVDAGVSFVETGTGYSTAMPNSSSGSIFFGNASATTLTRALDGWMDNIRVYDTVLDQTQLETIRQSDISFVPESSSTALCFALATALGGLMIRRWRTID